VGRRQGRRQPQDMKACMGGWEEENDGGAPSSSPSNVAIASDPSDMVVGEQGQDGGPILLIARFCCSSVDLTLSNITDHVSFLIFTSLSKYFIASYHPISGCFFSSCRYCVLDLHDRKRMLVPCIHCTCVSNHIGM